MNYARHIDGLTVFVVCSRHWQTDQPKKRSPGEFMMTKSSTQIFLIAAMLTALTTSAFAQAPAPAPWVLEPDMGYGYDKDGKTFSYKMGTNNAGMLLKGAKRVPKGTLFFVGHNGQLYIRTGPYLDGSGKFMFGTN
jgi:hypothetical protein